VGIIQKKMLNMAILDFPKPKPPESNLHSGDNLVWQNKLLSLLMRFQQTLDAKELIGWFAKSVEEEIGLDGYYYLQSEQAIVCQNGSNKRHKIAYTLTLEDQDLGEIKFYRSQPFSEFESQLVETFLAILVHPLNNALRYFQAISSSYIDPLTHLHNRTSMLQVMQRMDSLSCRGETTLSLLIVDIDYFTHINQKFGHINGDKVIRQVAEHLSNNLRDSDYIFHYVADKFVILLEDIETPQAMQIGERLRLDVASQSFTLHSDDGTPTTQKPIHTTVSVGISCCRNDDIMALLNQADHALYKAKSSGRNQVIAQQHPL